MLASTVDRVPAHTASHVNEQIERDTEQRVAQTVAAGPHAVGQRLEDLEHEWDVERTLEANAASVSLVGIALGAFVDRRFLLLPAVVGGFLLQHALQGWCPPLPLFRRLGVRTQKEIQEERYALKVARGDFGEVARDDIDFPADQGKVMSAVRR
jgi:hypothetical protein